MTPQTQLQKEQFTPNMIRHWQSPESQKIANEALESQKAIIDAQIDTARAQADTYNETLDSIQWVEEDINKTWFAGLLEKLKWTVSWIWEKTYNGLWIKNASETQKVLWWVAVWAGILTAWYFGIKKLFKWLSEDNKEDKKEFDDNKKESKEWILNSIWWSIRWLVKKVALWGGAALASTYLISYLLKGKSLWDLVDQFLEWIWLKKKSEGKAPGSEAGDATAVEDAEGTFAKEKLPVQATFNEIGEHTNNLYTTAGITVPSLLGQADFDKMDHNTWIIPYMLNWRYKTFGDFVGEQGIASESLDMDIWQMKDWLKKSFTDKPIEMVKNFFWWFANILWKVTFWLIQWQSTVEGIFSALQSEPNYDMIVKYAFHKSKMIHSYFQNRRTALETKLKTDWKTEEEIKSIVQDKLLSQEICTFDDAGNLVGWAYQYIKSQWLEVVKIEDIDSDLKEKIADSDKEKQSYLDKIKLLRDRKESSTITNQEIQELCKELDGICNDIDEDYNDFAIMPLMKIFGNEAAGIELYNNWPLKPMAEKFKASLKKIHDLWANVTVADLDDLNKQTDELYEFHQALMLSSWEMEESVDANGNTKAKRTLRTKNAIKATGSNIITGFEMVGKWDWLKWWTLLAGATLPLLMILTSTGRKVTLKLGKWTVMTGVEIGRLCKWWLWYGSKAYYDTTHGMKFAKDVLHGKISPKKAVTLANQLQLWGKWISFGSSDDVVKHLLDKQWLSDKQMQFIVDNMDELRKNKNLSKLLFQNGDNLSHTLRQRIKISGRSVFKDNTSLKVSLQHLDELMKLNPNGKITNIWSILWETVEVLDNKIWTITNEISKSTESLTKETKKIFQNFDKEVAKEAKKLKIVQWTQEYLELSKKIWEDPKYGKNKKLLDMIAKHNEDIAKHEKHILQLFNKASRKEKQLLCKNSLIKKIVDANGWIESRRILWGKARMISIGIHAVTLWWIWSNKDINGNKKSWKDIAIDAADFGASMIPVAWWAYDVYRAIRWTDLAWNNLSTTERRVRGWIWLVSIPLDIISFWAWWSLLKWWVKWWSKVLLKAWTKELAEEWAEIAIKQSTKKLILTNIAKGAARDILLGTVAGVALIPIIWHFKQEPLGDE